jgi:hypothetical protein
MAEKKKLDKLEIKFTGPFKLKELIKIIENELDGMDYDFAEESSEEAVQKDGKSVTLEFASEKDLDNYAKAEIGVTIEVENITNKVVELEGMKHKVQVGELKIEFGPVFITDKKSQWQDSGLQFLFRILTDKFIRRSKTEGYEDDVKSDAKAVYDETKKYLNMFVK